MHIVSVVGARPEFVQVATLSRELRLRHRETLVHTGQHYDDALSARFFQQLDLPAAEVNLGIGSLPPSAQVGEMMARLATAFVAADPDLVIVRGDTNSTLAASLVAKQLLLPLAHVEAGMRSFDRTAPEELNRVVSDHISDLFFVTDTDARDRLAAEGLRAGVHVCGDVMYDVFLERRDGAAASLQDALRAVAREPFDLLTLHRSENVDDRARLSAILEAFVDPPRPIVFPVHPRTRGRIEAFGLSLPAGIIALEPLGYLQMVALECAAQTIFTDSGGVQREAYFAETPCVTLRDATEWTNTIEAGWNRLTGADTAAIRRWLVQPPSRAGERPPLFGHGDAAKRIAAVLESEEVGQLISRARATRMARGV